MTPKKMVDLSDEILSPEMIVIWRHLAEFQRHTVKFKS